MPRRLDALRGNTFLGGSTFGPLSPPLHTPQVILTLMRHPSLKAFDTLPLKERLFVRGRLASAPLEALAERARGTVMLDVGCGHGVLVALLAEGHPERRIVGIDPDARKIAWAHASIGRNRQVELRACTIEALAAERPAAFDCLMVADVLYLLAPAAWPAFLGAARRLLRPGGRLVLKEAEDDGSWRTAKALWQERLMVRLLSRTHSSGAIGFASRASLTDALTTAGFIIDETAPFARGYSTPHLLFTAHVQ
jgi:2-polyprenyl-6-hydroxyphenyl methylase/3-demethylubiquinone-9 3-methyltransferase